MVCCILHGNLTIMLDHIHQIAGSDFSRLEECWVKKAAKFGVPAEEANWAVGSLSSTYLRPGTVFANVKTHNRL